jgi:hypothetical protein
MRWNILLATFALSALAACDSASSDAFGPNSSAAAQKAGSAGSDGRIVTDTAAAHTLANSAGQAFPALQLAGRAAAQCESARAVRVFVNETAALSAPTSPVVSRVLAGRPRLRLPALLEPGSRCPVGP